MEEGHTLTLPLIDKNV